MNFYLDTEFNGFGGELISMALVSDQGDEFYEVLPCRDPTPWVAEHVIPVLGKAPVNGTLFQKRLWAYLRSYNKIHVIADWPEDIAHFCRSMITGAGTCFNLSAPSFEIRILLGDNAPLSSIPHNALADARGLRDFLNRKGAGR